MPVQHPVTAFISQFSVLSGGQWGALTEPGRVGGELVGLGVGRVHFDRVECDCLSIQIPQKMLYN